MHIPNPLLMPLDLRKRGANVLPMGAFCAVLTALNRRPLDLTLLLGSVRIASQSERAEALRPSQTAHCRRATITKGPSKVGP